MTYITIDASNMFWRGRHVVKGDIDTKLGMCFHIMFNSVKKAWQDFGGTHLIFAFEGRSWRKDFYNLYKANRAESRAELTGSALEEDRIFWEAFDKFKEFIKEKTNCTMLQNPILEADDLIAGFIQSHTNKQHVIISTDSDFYQLIAPNVKQYNGVTEETHTLEGIFDKKGKPIKDKKTGIIKPLPDPEWLLFEKCMRGDKSDNVFAAYPGVRVKGTKNKVGLLEAFNDRNNKGWAWNNIMLQRWLDHNGTEHRVLDDYNRNRILIDLKAQPEHIRNTINQTILLEAQPKNINQVGIRLLKFCQLYNMQRIIDNIQSYAEPFQAKYK